jgi:signal transduction histidine kinase
VIGFSDMMASEIFGPLGDKRYRAYVDDIRSSGAHLLELISDILDLSRLDAGQKLDEEELELLALIRETVRMIQGHAEAAELTLEEKVAADLPKIWGDRRRLRQVLINVLSNAVKFTPARGRVTVTAFRQEGEVAITVRDTGIGIAKEDVHRAFEHFGQIDSALSRKYDGAGLGLPIAKKLIEAHGGRIELSSEPKAGTVVTIILPAERLIERPLCAA